MHINAVIFKSRNALIQIYLKRKVKDVNVLNRCEYLLKEYFKNGLIADNSAYVVNYFKKRYYRQKSKLSWFSGKFPACESVGLFSSGIVASRMLAAVQSVVLSFICVNIF